MRRRELTQRRQDAKGRKAILFLLFERRRRCNRLVLPVTRNEPVSAARSESLHSQAWRPFQITEEVAAFGETYFMPLFGCLNRCHVFPA